MDERIKRNLTSAEHWARLIYMLLFGLLLYVASFVVMVIVVLQFFFALFTGTDNRNVRRFGFGLTSYIQQMLMFLTYNSDIKPFPFTDWPETGTDIVEPSDEPLVEGHVRREPVFTKDTAAAAAPATASPKDGDISAAGAAIVAAPFAATMANSPDRGSLSDREPSARPTAEDSSFAPERDVPSDVALDDMDAAEPGSEGDDLIDMIEGTGGSTDHAVNVDLSLRDPDEQPDPRTVTSPELDSPDVPGDEPGDLLPEQTDFYIDPTRPLDFDGVDDPMTIPGEDPTAPPESSQLPTSSPADKKR